MRAAAEHSAPHPTLGQDPGPGLADTCLGPAARACGSGGEARTKRPRHRETDAGRASGKGTGTVLALFTEESRTLSLRPHTVSAGDSGGWLGTGKARGSCATSLWCVDGTTPYATRLLQGVTDPAQTLLPCPFPHTLPRQSLVLAPHSDKASAGGMHADRRRDGWGDSPGTWITSFCHEWVCCISECPAQAGVQSPDVGAVLLTDTPATCGAGPICFSFPQRGPGCCSSAPGRQGCWLGGWAPGHGTGRPPAGPHPRQGRGLGCVNAGTRPDRGAG